MIEQLSELSQLHFLHPYWLLGLLPLAGLLWLLYHNKTSNNAWRKIIDANLLPLLLSGSETRHNRSGLVVLAIAWFIATVALADPVWEKVSRPIFQTNAARVIVLDLSRSMLIPDLKPSRLARARFKTEDILSRQEEGQTGLVVFAGDAFTAAPLTRDNDTIRSLLNVLKPNIMPSQGSRADLGLLKALELLKQAGVQNGQVLLIADGVVGATAEIAAKKLNDKGHTVSVLAVGTEAGGIIPQLRPEITVKLDAQALQAVAKQGGGNYHLINNSNIDLQYLLKPMESSQTETNNTQSDLNNQDWKSNAPYLILLLLPLAALAFRRGWLLNVILLISVLGLTIQPQPAMAFSFADTWADLWQRQDQQANNALQQQKYKEASQLAKNPLRRGSAEYKQGNYQQALENFSKATGSEAEYNRGNTLAKLQKLKEAIKAYDNVLAQNENHDDAKTNKAIIEKLLKEKQKKDQDKKNNQNQNKEGQKQSENSKKNDSKNNKKNQAKQQNKNGQQENKKNQFSDAAKELEKNKDSKEAEQKSADQGDKKANNDKQDNKSTDPKTAEKTEAKPSNEKLNNGTNAQAEELSKEEKIAAEQWLRRIPDDPGGLLRRKFTRQYRQRQPQRNEPVNETNFW